MRFPRLPLIAGLAIVFFADVTSVGWSQPAATEPARLGYHPLRLDGNGAILPWLHEDPAVAFDQVIHRVWSFWDGMRTDSNGLPYYLNHQVWRPDFNDPRGLGGDQVAMALSSWNLYYQYTGNERVKENMRLLADHVLGHGLSPADCQWPNLPFPYNTLVYSGMYDGDMVLGQGFLQPDKAGSFGFELVTLYKLMSAERYPHATERRYLDAAIRIATTLAERVKPGDEDHSPLPFKVHAFSGEVGRLRRDPGDLNGPELSSYTTNWGGTLRLWLALIELEQGEVAAYRDAYGIVLDWMKRHPLRTHRWGPFFEDIPGWSDTQINAMAFARFILEHPSGFPNWREDVTGIIDWVYATLGNREWEKYGVVAVDEQTAYRTPGNSHTARQAADELLFAKLTGDEARKDRAVRQLSWATYMVDHDGRNCYPRDEVWLTDGYGDYVRHYLRAMAAAPERLAPPGAHRILATTSCVQHAAYAPQLNKFLTPVVPAELEPAVAVYYRTFDEAGTEQVWMPGKPRAIWLNRHRLLEVAAEGPEGWRWQPARRGGLVTIVRHAGREVFIGRADAAPR